MNYGKIILISLVSVTFFLHACTPKEQAFDRPQSDNLAKPVEPGAVWEMEWEQTLVRAKKENNLMVMVTGEPAAAKAVNEEFEKRFGIRITLISAGVGLVQEKLLSERRAGLYTVDIFFGGGTSTIGLKPLGAFDTVEKIPVLPEVVDSKVWWKGKLDYIDKEKFVIAFAATPTIPLAVNTEMVASSEEPKAWKDLLNSRWKGKIVMGDPRIDGNASSNFTVVAYYQPEAGLDFWRELVRQDPVILRDQRLQVEWLAKGKYSVLISPATKTMKSFIDIGAPLKWIMPGGVAAISSGSGNVALVNRPPHPNAAKIYINYLLTREAQTIYSRESGYQSGRVDVPTDHLEALKVRKSGTEYIETNYEDFALKTIESRKVAMEIFK